MAKNRKPGQSTQAKTNAAEATPSIVLHQIDVRPFSRREQDVTSWRSALRSAEGMIPRRVLLYDLYADVDLDGHVEAVTGKRRDAVTNANWQFVDKEGVPVEEINQLIDSIGFEELLEEIINSKFWGYSILEPTFFQTEDGSWEMAANLIPRLNYRPEKGIVAYDQTSETGVNIREGFYAKTVMEVGKPNDLGLYNKVAPYQVLKRGGVGDWALFVQVFGNPIVDATWDGFDEGQRLKLLDAINSLGSGGALVRPAGTNVSLIENKSNANGDLQDKFMSFLNREISKALLGSTETTESSASSGYAQAETHAGQDDKKNESDINFARRVLNSRFIKILNAHGFAAFNGRFIIEGEDNELTTKESFEIHKALRKELGLQISDDFFYETYGIPKPENYQERKPEEEIEEEETEEEEIEPGAKTKKPVKPKKKAAKKQEEEEPDEDEEEAEELSYLGRLLKLFSFFPVASAKIEATTVEECCGDHLTIELSEGGEPDFKRLLNAIKSSQGSAFVYEELIDLNVQALSQAFVKGWKGEPLVKLADLGIEYGALDPKMATAWESNIFRFSTVKAAYQSREVNELFRRAKNFAEFERAVKKLYGVTNKKWLITEYNTAYQTAEAASTYYRLMGQLDAFPFWEYRTIGDGRVRDAHKAIHGVILPANHQLWAKVFPPNGWGCRCYVVPRLASEVNEAKVKEDVNFVQSFIEKDEEWMKAKKQGFAVNRANIQEVFTQAQQYSKTPDKILTKVSKMSASMWKMKAAQELQDKAEREFVDRQETIQEELWSRHQIDSKTMALADYAQRPIELDKAQIASVTGDRLKILSQLEDVLSQPDEVWINDVSGRAMDSFVYLRYYRGETIRVVAKLNERGDLSVSYWDSIQANPETARRGLPIRKS
jgi:SPP1 gp7 family putative phage head morphogenesis protein